MEEAKKYHPYEPEEHEILVDVEEDSVWAVFLIGKRIGINRWFWDVEKKRSNMGRWRQSMISGRRIPLHLWPKIKQAIDKLIEEQQHEST